MERCSGTSREGSSLRPLGNRNSIIIPLTLIKDVAPSVLLFNPTPELKN
jgi:hypothetical protein